MKDIRCVRQRWGFNTQTHCRKPGPSEMEPDGGEGHSRESALLGYQSSCQHDCMVWNARNTAHTISGAHAFNPTVKKSCDQVPGLTDIRTRPSTTAKERFAQVQQQMGMAVLKQIEVPTRWNSTYNMLAGMTEHRQPGWVSLGSSKKKPISLLFLLTIT